MTIDELARTTGTTTRTIRSYQDRGLLPPPTIVGRTGHYDNEHLARLQVISRLLEERFSLASIAALLQAWETGQSLAQLLGFVEDLAATPDSNVPRRITKADLQDAFPAGHVDWRERAVELGILHSVSENEWDVDSPHLLEHGAKLVAAGVPVEVMLEEGAELRADCERIAQRFVEMFTTFIWQPFREAGRPASELHRVVDYLAVIRPLPVEATSVMLAQAMQRALEKGLAELLASEGVRDVESAESAESDRGAASVESAESDRGAALEVGSGVDMGVDLGVDLHDGSAGDRELRSIDAANERRPVPRS